MILTTLSPTCAAESIPRESGDDPVVTEMEMGVTGYSPRERG